MYVFYIVTYALFGKVGELQSAHLCALPKLWPLNDLISEYFKSLPKTTFFKTLRSEREFQQETERGPNALCETESE